MLLIAKCAHLKDCIADTPDDPADCSCSHIIMEQLSYIDIIGEVPAAIGILIFLQSVKHLHHNIPITGGTENQKCQSYIVRPAPGI